MYEKNILLKYNMEFIAHISDKNVNNVLFNIIFVIRISRLFFNFIVISLLHRVVRKVLQ